MEKTLLFGYLYLIFYQFYLCECVLNQLLLLFTLECWYLNIYMYVKECVLKNTVCKRNKQRMENVFNIRSIKSAPLKILINAHAILVQNTQKMKYQIDLLFPNRFLMLFRLHSYYYRFYKLR